MGLTIHYKLSVTKYLASAVVRELADRTALYARKCHRQIISLLDFWRQLGVIVEVNDEGEYWQTRSQEKLRNKLQQYDGLVAAVGGIMKDASADEDTGLSIVSPIFDYANFEWLEHE